MEIETVAGDADAAMRERRRAEAVRVDIEAQDGKVRCAAAEIGDQHGRALLQVAREMERGRHRFVDEQDFVESELFQRRAIALRGEGGIGRRAGIFDGPPDHEPLRRRQRVASVRPQAREKFLEQVFEAVALRIDIGAVEQGARRECLQRLHETAVFGVLQIAPHGPRPDLALRAFLAGLLPEGERRAQGLGLVVVEREGERARDGAVAERKHGICGAEIEAERARHGSWG